jgi:FtsZ-interacting cell division protein ZipA
MFKNQKGGVNHTAIVVIVVAIAFIAVLGLGFWAILSSKQRSAKLLNDTGKAHTSSQQKQQ